MAFPMHVSDDSVDVDPVLVPYSKLEAEGSYYICGLAVASKSRSLDREQKNGREAKCVG